MIRKGSSLVYVLLTMAVVSVVLLAGSGALLSAARQRGAVESSKAAELMRQTAYQEGEWLVQKGTTQYGVTGGTTILQPILRGFSDTACTQWIVTGGTAPLASQLAAPQQNCPRYQLAIRDRLTLSGTNGDTYTYQAKDFATLPVDIAVGGTLITFTAQLPFSSVTYQLCNASKVCGSSSTANAFSVDPASSFYVRIIATTPAISTPDTTGVLKASSIGTFTVGKTFTTVEATGIAPDSSESRSLTIVRSSGTVTIPTTERFTDLGVCKPDPTACR
jgi:hypothetical protein